jgi:hypothetical protein
MFVAIVSLALSTLLSQTPPANFACSVLTPAHVMALIGAVKTLPMGNAPNGSTCMFQNDDKIITVLTATNASAEGAQRLFDNKKRMMSGADVPGWGVPAYSTSMKGVAMSGVLKQQTFVEVKVSDPTQKADVLMQKLQAAMKEFAVRK